MPAGTVSVIVAHAVKFGELRDALAAAAAARAGVQAPGGTQAAALFARADDAVACALELRGVAALAECPPGIAVHTGRSSGPADAVPVRRCAALARIAAAGQVLLSQASASLVSADLPPGADLADLGWHRLADLGPAEHVWQLRHPQVPDAFPPPRSLDAYQHNLPVELTSFVSRDAELTEIAALIDSDRLVTLTGAGGCGKTRLALHAAADRIAAYADGMRLVELAALRDPVRVPATIADVLHARQRGPDSGPGALAAAIGTSELLLMLDNCEHLVRPCAEVTDYLLRACPRLRILATSREPLGVPGEVTWRVPSLAPSDAVRLFAERARQARPGFALTTANQAAAAEICARLDGIPLAIELAAARVRVLAVGQIAAGLTDRFRLLTGGARTAVPRQQTLEASVAWSYDLLTEPERAALRQLSVFAGGFTLAAAETVVAGAGPVTPLVSQLADKSLIVAAADDRDRDGRFRVLETIREYAAEQLAEAGELAGAQARHFRFYCRALDRGGHEDEDAYCERLRQDYDNIRAALGWAARQDDPGLLLGVVTRLVVFWSASTHLAEAVGWLRLAIDRGKDADPGLRARALGGLTQIASLALDMPVAFAAGTEGLALLRELGDTEGIIMTLTSLGSIATLMGEPDSGRSYLHEAIALAERSGDQRALAYALAVRGRAAVNWPGDRLAGRKAARRAIEVAKQCGARHVEGIALCILGALSALDCDPGEAIGPLTASLPLLREAGDVFFLSLSLIGVVQCLSLRGDYADASAACEELDSISGKLGPAQLYFAPCARGFAAYARGDWPVAIGSLRETLTFFTPVSMIGQWLGHLAWSEFIAGQPKSARDRLDEFTATADPARTSLAVVLAARAVVARSDGQHEMAADLAQRAIADAPSDPFGRATVVECLAVVAAVRADVGDYDVAVRLAGASAAFADIVGMRLVTAVRALTDPVLRTCRDALGEDGYGAAWSQGRQLTLEEAVGYATRGRGHRSRPKTGWESLTPTERAVAAAIADGLSNPQIAARMFISRRTVTTHLTSIFHKLGISSRAELAAEAARRH